MISGFRGCVGDFPFRPIRPGSAAQLTQAGDRFIYETGGSLVEKYEDASLIVLYTGRLDNIEELAGKCGTSYDDQDDSAIVADLYKRESAAVPAGLIGDFSFVIFDKTRRHLLLAKDQLGIKPLFWYQTDHALLFATRIADLIDLLAEKPKINQEYIATELLNYTQPVDKTFYSDLYRLKPAHFGLFRPSGKWELKPYWDLKRVDLSHLHTDEAVMQELRKLLFQAVACRIRKANRVGCQLSGGIDSSLIAVVLSRIMGTDRLYTSSFVLNEKTAAFVENPKDEKDTQQAVIRFAALKPENHHNIEEFHFRDFYDEMDSIQEVYAGIANSDCIWQETLFKEAAEKQGVQVMFSGFPGDEGISNSGMLYYYDYIGRLQVWRLIRLLLTHPVRTLKQLVKYGISMIRGEYRKGFRKIQRSRSLLAPDSVWNKRIRYTGFTFYPTFKKFLKKQMLRSHTTLRSESEGFYAGKYGIHTVYPLADIRLLEFVYSLPTRFFEPKDYPRQLIRDLSKGLIPENVRLQPKRNGAKTLAFADYWHQVKYEQIKDRPIHDHFGLFVSPDQIQPINNEKGLVEYIRMNKLHETDLLIEKNLT